MVELTQFKSILNNQIICRRKPENLINEIKKLIEKDKNESSNIFNHFMIGKIKLSEFITRMNKTRTSFNLNKQRLNTLVNK